MRPGADHRTRRLAARLVPLAAVAVAAAMAGCGEEKPPSENSEVAAWVAKLKTGNVEVRREAIENLCRIDHPDVVEPLLTAAKTESQWDLRITALRGLARPGIVKDVGPIMELLDHSNADIRQTACSVLGQLKASRAEDALAARLSDEQATVRHAAMRALADLGPKGLARLDPVLKSGPPDERLIVIEAIGAAGDRGRIQPLIDATTDPNGNVRRAAADALGKLGDPDAVKALAALIREPIPNLRQWERDTMQHWIDSKKAGAAAGVLKEAMATDYPLTVIRRRLEWERWEGMIDPLRAVQQVLETEPRTTRQIAMTALCRIEDPSVQQALADLLVAEDPDLLAMVTDVLLDRSPQMLRTLAADPSRPAPARRQALKALVEGRQQDAQPDAEQFAALLSGEVDAAAPSGPAALPDDIRALLTSLLNDKAEPVRVYSAYQLALRDDPSAFAPLKALLNSRDADVKLLAVRGLAHAPDDAAAADLIQILRQTQAQRDQQQPLRRAAIETLGAMKARQATQVLVAIATDLDAPLMGRAIFALGQIGDPAVGDALLAFRPKLLAAEAAAARGSDRQRALSTADNELILALGRAKATKAIPVLVEMMQGDPGKQPVHQAMEALGYMGDASAVEPLIQRVGRKPYRVKDDRYVNYTTQTGIAALVRLGDPRAVALFERFIVQPPDAWTRNYAYDALGNLKHPASAKVLTGLLGRSDVDVAVKKAKISPALAALGPVAKPALLEMLTETPAKPDEATYDPGVFAAQLLALLEADALADLTRLAKTEKRKHVLGRVVIALADMRSVESVDAMKLLLTHKDPLVRQWAIGAVSRYKAEKREAARPLVEAATRDSDEKVAQWARQTLDTWNGREPSKAAATTPAPTDREKEPS